jgi:hypothetical protein
MDEPPIEKEEMPDPRISSRAWAERLLLTDQLEYAEEYSR